MRVLGGGKQSVRATVMGTPATAVALRVNDYFNGGGEGFLGGHYAREMRRLKAGATLTGTTHLHLLLPK